MAINCRTVKGKGDYNHVLPNLDIRVNVTDEVVARMSYSQTIGRAPYANLFASTTAGCAEPPDGARWPDRRQLARIRALLPLESENFDVSLEWYYGPDSYVSVGFFDKTVTELRRHGCVHPAAVRPAGPDGGRAGLALGRCPRRHRYAWQSIAPKPICSRWLR